MARIKLAFVRASRAADRARDTAWKKPQSRGEIQQSLDGCGRTTGTQAQTYLITGPNWSGTVPAGMSQLQSPTSLVWLLGRIYCTGTVQDYAEVHALQDRFKLQPLSTWGKDYTPPPGVVDPSIDMKMSVRDQVNRLRHRILHVARANGGRGWRVARAPGRAQAPA
jgi:hypothetical protein